MFSGITHGLFPIARVEKLSGLIRYAVELNAELVSDLKIGASVAIDGVCQSVASIDKHRVTFEAMQKTLDVTTFKDLEEGGSVSVERSVCYGDEIGGHEVSGHVSSTAKIVAKDEAENNLTLTLLGDKTWMKYVFSKGFIAVNGSSLTVADVDFKANTFKVCLIPETLRVTDFANKKIGDRLNVEVESKTKAIVDTVEKTLQEKMHEAV